MNKSLISWRAVEMDSDVVLLNDLFPDEVLSQREMPEVAAQVRY